MAKVPRPRVAECEVSPCEGVPWCPVQYSTVQYSTVQYSTVPYSVHLVRGVDRAAEVGLHQAPALCPPLAVHLQVKVIGNLLWISFRSFYT